MKEHKELGSEAVGKLVLRRFNFAVFFCVSTADGTCCRMADKCSRYAYACVCVYYCRTYYKAVCGGGRGTVQDMCYEVRRAEACVD